MNKIITFLLGTLILSAPATFLFYTDKFICRVLCLVVMFVIVFSGPAEDRKFWKEYFKIILPLPKEFDK